MILNGSKKEIPCFHRPILIQIDSPLPQDDTQAVSRRSDVVLQNKSTPNIIFHFFCLWFWMALKMETPCFHRTISIQIDSSLPQDDTQAVSRQSDVELHNKSSPNLIFHFFCLWFWMALKMKLPDSTEQFQFRLTVHYPRMTLKQFPDDLMLFYIIHNKSSQNLSFYLTCLWFWMALKMETPCFHRTISIQIDSSLPQKDTQAVSRQSDVELHNKSSPNLIFHFFCLWFWIALKMETPFPQNNFNSDWQSTTPGWHSSSFQMIWCCFK